MQFASMKTAMNADGRWRGWGKRLLTEPTIHFLLIGALLFVAHRLLRGDAHTVIVSAGTKSALQRRFRDQTGHAPNAAEFATLLRDWKREEVLYREALRLELDRDDATIRSTLADRMRARAIAEFPTREPTDAELQAWLAAHRQVYETPQRYEYEFVKFAKSEPNVREQLDSYDQALRAGKNPSTASHPISGGNLTAEELQEHFGAELTQKIRALSGSDWQRFETTEALFLARLLHVEGGLPSFDALRRQLIADWSLAQLQTALEGAEDRIVARYRFEERP